MKNTFSFNKIILFCTRFSKSRDVSLVPLPLNRLALTRISTEQSELGLRVHEGRVTCGTRQKIIEYSALRNS
jgi:hypothetical protein